MPALATGLHALRALPPVELVPLLGIPAYWTLGFFVFLAWSRVRGMPRTDRIVKAGSRILPDVISEYGYWQFRLPIRAMRTVGVRPDHVTYFSLLAAVASGVAFGIGRFSTGGWLLALASACDAMDGILARELDASSERGEYLDSLVDRYADFAVVLGLAWYWRDRPLASLLVAAALVGSQVMGYAKAKGEAVGIDPKVGWMQRHERCAYLVIASVLSPIAACFLEPGAPRPLFHLTLATVGIIGLLTNATAIARARFVLARLRGPSARPVEAAHEGAQDRGATTVAPVAGEQAA